MNETDGHNHHPGSDRKLGDEWFDWDGRTDATSADTDGRVFIGLAFATIIVILGATALFAWLVSPRLEQIGHGVRLGFDAVCFAIAGFFILWLLLFIYGALTKRPFLSGFIIIPKLVNFLLEATIKVGTIFGVNRDRLFNSFLKLHNLIVNSDPRKVRPERMLVILPRCLTREMNAKLREMRDRYGFMLTAAGGGTEARKKIREVRPGLIIAVACERDLLTGFIDVNPHIPVIGFPNIRPCGPCKDTEVDLTEIENTVKRHLIIATPA
jgi:hypothetical protein